jgi:hypothetical protein
MLKSRREGHQVGADVDYLCEVLSQLGAAQCTVEPRVGVVTGRVDNGPRRPLDAHHAHVGESSLCHLLLQLSARMKEGVGEPEGGVVHAGGQHWHQLSRDVGGEAAALRPVEDRHESSDGRGEQDPTGPQDSPRFGERRDPLSSNHKVVERPEDEHCVDRRIRLREPAGVADFGSHQPVLSGGPDMPRDDVDEMHAVAPPREPGRVYAGAAADVEHQGRRGWQLTLQQLARAKQLEAVMGKPEKALPLVLPRLVRQQVLTFRHHPIVDEP